MIPLFKVHMPESVMEPLRATLLSGYIGQGPKVEEFEKALAPWLGNPNVLTVNACTSAIHLALRLAGAERGTEVISSPMTCAATTEPILERGADIVWADIDPWTGNIDPLDVARKITPKTKAVIAVHWAGYPCDLDELLKTCSKHSVALIEDAAHAFGAAYKGRPIGCHSDSVCFSLQAIKHVTSGDGGLLACKAPTDYRRGKLLRWFGIDREVPRTDLRCESDILEYGYKFHMNDIAATIGLEQLKYVAGILERHRANAKAFDEALDGLRRVKKLRYAADRTSSYWIYTIRVSDRDSFQEHLKKAGIMVSQVHVRNDIHTAFRPFRRNLPGVDEFSKEQVSIPVGWWVTPDDVKRIVSAVREWDAL
jgi:dTDP-4-amino-4,6-dideoxygalactose transaminase